MKDGDRLISNIKLRDSKPYYFNLRSVVDACIDGLSVENGWAYFTAPQYKVSNLGDRRN